MTIKEKISNNSKILFPAYRAARKKLCMQDEKKIERLSELDNAAYEQELIKRLRETVDFAFTHVPWYREKFRAVGYRKGDLRSLDDMRRLPLLKKSEVKENQKVFFPTGVVVPYSSRHTGGSTDVPMALRLDWENLRRSDAYFAYYWKKMGFDKYRDRCIFLLGNRYYYKNGREKLSEITAGLDNWVRVNANYVTDPSYAARYKSLMEHYHAKALKGYTSFVYGLARSMETAGIEPPQFDYVLLNSENMYPDELRYIKEAYRAKDIIYHYGQTENVSLAVKFPGTDYLGFMQFFGYSELLDANGMPVEKAGEIGQIVGTSYDRSMPLIRYCMDDYATKSSYRGTGWMRRAPAIERVEGRKQDFLVTKAGLLAPLLMVSRNDSIETLKLTGDTQYYQDTPGKVTVRVTGVRGEKIPPEMLDAIKAEYVRLAGEDFDFQIEQVDAVKRTRGNKRMLVEQRLDLSDYHGSYAHG